MYVVAGVSGHTGAVVANTLLAQHLPVRVVVRSAEKGEAWKKKGAEVAVADLTNAAALTAALKGATGAYLLLPPNFAMTDLMSNAKVHAAAMKTAINDSGVKHVVFLSSIGAQHAEGTGPVVMVAHMERELATCAAHVTFLRPGYFMENLLANVQPMQAQGVLPTLYNAATPVHMVATADIGAEAAWLLRQGVAAPRMVELAGPADYTVNEAAAHFGKAMKKTITPVFVPEAGRVEALKGAGLPEVMAKAYAEMGTAFDSGRVKAEGPVRRGLVTLERFIAGAMSK